MDPAIPAQDAAAHFAAFVDGRGPALQRTAFP